MKHVKMMLYGAPGVGKSVFAYGFPKPYFITTDGNYEWLEDFGAKEEDHAQVNSFAEMCKVFNGDFNGYDTIVVDLLEDGFKWCEQEFTKSQGVSHISDLGYGKGYDITRNTFFIEISKLINKPKNVIFLSHEITKVSKDRRGVEHYSYRPSDKLPDKLLDSIEGRMRYVLRCYMKNEDVPGENGKHITVTKRYLSLVPKEDEFGIIRGVNTNSIPQDIPLDAKKFLDIVLNAKPEIVKVDNTEVINTAKTEALNEEVKKFVATTPVVTAPKPAIKTEPVKQVTKVETPKVEEVKPVVNNEDLLAKMKQVKTPKTTTKSTTIVVKPVDSPAPVKAKLNAEDEAERLASESEELFDAEETFNMSGITTKSTASSIPAPLNKNDLMSKLAAMKAKK